MGAEHSASVPRISYRNHLAPGLTAHFCAGAYPLALPHFYTKTRKYNNMKILKNVPDIDIENFVLGFLLIIQNEEIAVKKYAYRAECSADEQLFVNALLDRNIPFRFDIDSAIVEGTVIDVDEKTSLAVLWDILNNLEDCHVMADTINLIEKFDGERRYGNPPKC